MTYYDEDDKPLTRKERRKLRKQGVYAPAPKNNGLRLKHIMPKTINQNNVFKAYENGSNILVHGYPGTGKTFLALALALDELLDGDGQYKKIVIIRSAVASRQQGFLPGSAEEKVAVFEKPYIDTATQLFGRGDAYSILKQSGRVEFETTSFLRGTTFDDTIVIVDECQNMNGQEINTVMTRIGENSKIILLGDYRQNDLAHSRVETSYMPSLIKIVERMRSFTTIEMQIEDIVRGPVVKDWIITKEALGL